MVFPGPPPAAGLDPPGRVPGLVSGLVAVPVPVRALLGPVWGRFFGRGEAAACVEGREVRRGSDMVQNRE